MELMGLVGLMACAALWPVPIWAETTAKFCAPRDVIIDHITNKRHETLHSYGLVGVTTVVEIYAGQTGSWSIIATNTHGQTCVLGFGQRYETLSPPAGKPA